MVGSAIDKIAPVRTVILTGPPGAGKTSVLTALSDSLVRGDVPHAAVELEAPRLGSPASDDEATFAHLQVLAASYGRRGYPLLLASATIERANGFRQLVDAAGVREWSLVRLEASSTIVETDGVAPESLATRIRNVLSLS